MALVRVTVEGEWLSDRFVVRVMRQPYETGDGEEEPVRAALFENRVRQAMYRVMSQNVRAV